VDSRYPRSVAVRLVWIAATLASITVLSVQPAWADGDPASDVLITSNAYVPYSAQPSDAATALSAEIAKVSTPGHRVKVAVIASPVDLGAVPSLFGKPTEYAKFLGTELSQFYSGVLLIVMPAGLGVYHRGTPTAKAEAAIAGVAVGSGSPEDLLKAATDAVSRLAAAGAIAWKDRIPPQVSIAPATGRRGESVKLRYALFDDSGKSGATAKVVLAPSHTVARWKLKSRSLRGYQLFTITWRVPRTLPRGKLSFCVAAKDPAGHTSPRSCVPLRIS
jgi:hypothetical protein